jgi:hypothetical protein
MTMNPSSSNIAPTFSNIQYPPQHQQSTSTGPTAQFPPTIPPPFNFAMPNPQQQQYFQPIPSSSFPNAQQQPPVQFNPNAVNTSSYASNNHGHSHEYNCTGHDH